MACSTRGTCPSPRLTWKSPSSGDEAALLAHVAVRPFVHSAKRDRDRYQPWILDHVMYWRHHWFTRIHTEPGENWDECRAERFERLLRFPDVEDLDVAICLQGDVV